ncbi:hypothetical protein O7635_16495 [Asanoa sp. WMMD1127]|uniref:hypothetical protein n=1 Tax=Asanoa sp. WMMD1127 TaxID=3016107 RepID=UPI0024175B4E|nr:hypothetical protein [Asanoa sp. WMMD1127]MDG4823458.1 hypothetical protein [Asanoa sp. WMMD1127]
MSDRRELFGDQYGEDVLDEVTVPRTDPVREAKDRDLADPVDPEVLRNGGPTRSGGAVTTTGGTAGPASVRRVTNPDAAPTTTGDATTGGMEPPIGGSTSDASTGANEAGQFTER